MAAFKGLVAGGTSEEEWSVRTVKVVEDGASNRRECFLLERARRRVGGHAVQGASERGTGADQAWTHDRSSGGRSSGE